MRNPPKQVDEVTRQRTLRMAHTLAEVSEPVTIRYEKRNGEVKDYTGLPVDFLGVVGTDKFSVVISGDPHPHTLNLCRVKSITKPVL